MSGRHYGVHIQEECIDTVVELSIQLPAAPLGQIFHMLSPCFNIIRTQNLCCWHKHYVEWVEVSQETQKKKREFHLKCCTFKRTNVVTDKVFDILRSIVEEALELYLNKIAKDLCSRSTYLIQQYIVFYMKN